MNPSMSVEQEARQLLEAENQARYNAAVQAVAERRERERQAAEHAAKIDALKARLSSLDTSPIDHLHAKASAVLDAYVAAMTAHNEQIAVLRDDLQALGNLPSTVNLGSHENGYGLTIGDVEVRRQRPQNSVSRLATAVLKAHNPRGPFSLDNPKD